VEDLVAGRLVGVALNVVDRAMLPVDEQVGRGRARAEALAAQFAGFALQDERPARSAVRRESFRRHRLRVRLPADGGVEAVVERVADFQAGVLGGMQSQRGASLAYECGPIDAPNGAA